MFSTRFNWQLATNRLALLMAEKQQAAVPVLDLTESNPTRVGFSYPADEMLGALAQSAWLRYEPQPRGLLVARRAVSDYYRARGYTLAPNDLHLTASTSEAYAYLFKLLADHQHNVLVPQPSYPLLELLSALEGIELRPYPLHYVHPRGWMIDFDQLEKALTPDTRAIILVNPNNPTGSFVKWGELARLNHICARQELALIVDEVFSDYAFSADAQRAASAVGNADALTFVLSGLSKILALPQMKLAWIATSGPRRLRDAAIERLDLIADTFLSVGAPVQHAAASWLALRPQLQRQILDRVRANHAWLAARTQDSPCRLLTIEGGWYATLEVPRHCSEEEWVLRLLKQDNVLAHPGYFFDFPREAFLVLSLLPPPPLFQEAMGRLLARIK